MASSRTNLAIEDIDHSRTKTKSHRAQIGFRKNDNAFLAIDDVADLRAAADKLSFRHHPRAA
jgi:hypothetical protein